ncbi:prolipoprotein diacylglyceryl transferase [Candidatus Omnitrophota bacterium]
MHRIIYQIGPFTIYSYGLMVALGFLLSTIFILRDSKKFGLPRDAVFDCLIAILISGIVGGRLLFVLINYEYYLRYPLRVFLLNEGGMAIQGALIAALLAGTVVVKWTKLPFWRTSDLIAPYIALGQAIGRIGCFLNGCCYGAVTDSGIGITFPGESVVRIPTQVYSSVFLLMIFTVLITLRDRRPFDGCLFSMYLMLYSFFRFFMDFFRGDDLAFLGGLTLSQTISIGIFTLGAVLFFILAVRGRTRTKTNR